MKQLMIWNSVGALNDFVVVYKWIWSYSRQEKYRLFLNWVDWFLFMLFLFTDWFDLSLIFYWLGKIIAGLVRWQNIYVKNPKTQYSSKQMFQSTIEYCMVDKSLVWQNVWLNRITSMLSDCNAFKASWTT